jgi:predicted nuclease with TOPRIM domain
MTAPKIDPKVSLGNILNFLALLVAVAVGWGMMSERGENTRQQLQELRETLTQEITARRSGNSALEDRVRALENSQARADERFNSVLQVLGRIEARLERIEGK